MLESLTIIIPCLEEVNLLEQCLDSIHKNLLGQKVYIIQMSDWKTNPLINKNLAIQTLRTSKRSAAAARNLGAKLVDSDYIWFLDSDNWLAENGIDWQVAIETAIAQKPDLIVLQRAEENRKISLGVTPNRWNFSRHCIEWNLIWSRRHFLSLGGLDETCCTGSDTMAQSGEAFTLCFKHFDLPAVKTIYLPKLLVKHPVLSNPNTPIRKVFEYAYGGSYATTIQIRRSPSFLSLFWFIRNLIGFIADFIRGLKHGLTKELVYGRFLGLWDALTKKLPRERKIHN